MFGFAIKRFFYGLTTLFIIATLTFFLMHSLPGDPFASEKAIPPKVKAKLMEKYHLDKPLIIQYGYYLKDLLKGDLGLSMKIRGRRVNSMIKNHFPYSLDLGLRAVLFALVAGGILGTIAGLKRGKKWDHLSMIVAILGVSVPGFIMGGLLQWAVVSIGNWLSIKLGMDIKILPVGGYASFAHTILPTIALGLMPLAVIARMMRASMIEVLSQDYIKTAKAKGLSPIKIIVKHGIRNAIMPVVTYLGPLIAMITTGSFVVEQVFSIPGLGRFYVTSLYNRDYTVVLGITIFYAAILIFMIFLVDIIYGLLDPRIRVAKGRGKKKNKKKSGEAK